MSLFSHSPSNTGCASRIPVRKHSPKEKRPWNVINRNHNKYPNHWIHSLVASRARHKVTKYYQRETDSFADTGCLSLHGAPNFFVLFLFSVTKLIGYSLPIFPAIKIKTSLVMFDLAASAANVNSAQIPALLHDFRQRADGGAKWPNIDCIFQKRLHIRTGYIEFKAQHGPDWHKRSGL